MSNEATQTAPTGGADWELGKAAGRMNAAQRAFMHEPSEANSDELDAALRDYAAALGSKSTAMAAALFRPLFEGQQQTHAAVEGLRDRWEQRFDYMLGAISAHQKKTDTRLDAYGGQIDANTAAVEANGARLGKLETDNQELKTGQRTYIARLDALDERHEGQWDQVITRLVSVEQRLDADEEEYRARLDRKRAELNELSERFDAYVSANRRAEFDELRARIAALETEHQANEHGDGP